MSLNILRSVLKNIRRSTPAARQSERRLNVGGEERRAEWEVLNAVAGPYVDHVGDASDLSRFPDATFAELYASHVLEHLDFMNEMQTALREWHRVLVPGGRLFVSVPDLAVLAGLFLQEGFALDDRFGVIKMIFGAHASPYDYHKVGFDMPVLTYFLKEAGFVDIRRVADLGLFNDTSRAVFSGVAISLNVVAQRPST